MRLIDVDDLIDFIDMGHLRNPLESCFSERDVVCMLESRPTVDAVPVVRCRECKHLNVVNRKELYAHCPKTNTVFLPFELDTREHFCSLGERKEGADNEP